MRFVAARVSTVGARSRSDGGLRFGIYGGTAPEGWNGGDCLNTTHPAPLDSSKRGRKISLSFDQVFDQREEEALDHALQQSHLERFSWSDRADAKGELNTSHLTETPISTARRSNSHINPAQQYEDDGTQEDGKHAKLALRLLAQATTQHQRERAAMAVQGQRLVHGGISLVLRFRQETGVNGAHASLPIPLPTSCISVE